MTKQKEADTLRRIGHISVERVSQAKPGRPLRLPIRSHRSTHKSVGDHQQGRVARMAQAVRYRLGHSATRIHMTAYWFSNQPADRSVHLSC